MVLQATDVIVAGRVLSARVIHADLIENSFRNAWFEVNYWVRPESSSKGNMFLFQFDTMKPVHHNLKKGPWSLNNQLEVMNILKKRWLRILNGIIYGCFLGSYR